MNRYSALLIGYPDPAEDDDDRFEIVELSNGKFAVIDITELEALAS